MPKFNFNSDDMPNIKNFIKDKTKYPVISQCPVCHHDLVVERLACDHCGSAVEGRFALSKFNYLDTDKLYFIEIFVKNRGNIKAIEKEMNLSYPTIKKLLDEDIITLGYKPESVPAEESNAEPEKVQPQDSKSSKSDILDKLSQGAMSVEEALEKLKKIR